MKVCNKCGETKEITEFYPHTRQCKVCRGKQTKQYRIRIGYNKFRRSVSKTIVGKATNLLSHMRMRSVKLKLPMPEFTLDEVVAAVQGKCCKSGIPFKLTHTGPSLRNPFAPSPDRINPNLGYTKENVQWVCWIYNAMKSDFSEEDVNVFVSGLLANHAQNAIG